MNRNRNTGKRNVKFASGTKPGSEKGKQVTEDKSPDDTKTRPEPKPSYADKVKANSAITVSRGLLERSSPEVLKCYGFVNQRICVFGSSMTSSVQYFNMIPSPEVPCPNP
jgi:hypothetical protein